MIHSYLSLNVSRKTISCFLHEEFESLKMKPKPHFTEDHIFRRREMIRDPVANWQIHESSAMKSCGA